ncbi:hypothetical protein VKT23_018572 [Stygiomarasmius scandens]|uniref:Uncharacterized protein n=1 Tax=Marasmiellus scandens TaxID=2682957 RepID=A0ABR1IR78_9AGAR
MNLTTFLLFPVLLIILYWLSILTLHLFGKSHPPLPPGPKGLPIIGDVLSALNNKRLNNGVVQTLCAHYIEMGKKYGSDIIHINVLGDHTIVLNSVKHTNELLEKRSALYSDRPCTS